MLVTSPATERKLDENITLHREDRVMITCRVKGGSKKKLDNAIKSAVKESIRTNTEVKVNIGETSENTKEVFEIEFYSVYTDSRGEEHKRSPRDWSLNRLPHMLVEKRRKDTYTYEFPPTEMNLEILNHLLLSKKEYAKQIVVNDLAKLRLKVVQTESKVQDNLATNIARWRDSNKIPYQCKFNVDHAEFPLTRYQQLAAHNCLENPNGYALFMEQGTGKTPVAINVMCNEARQKCKKDPNELYRVLVICPKGVRYNWDSELEKFSTVKYKTTIIRGNAFDRETDILWSLFKDPKDIQLSVVIASYDSVARSEEVFALEKVAGKKVKVKWDLVILDESHYIKSRAAKRTKSCMKLREASKKRIVLTGTPITNTLLDLYSQLEFIEKNGSGFSSFQAYKDFYGVYRLDEMGRKELVDFENIPFIQERLAKVGFSVRSEEALPDLPEKVYDAIECNITKKQRDAYMKVAAGIAIEAEQELANLGSRPQKMVANNILTKMLKLSQITSGFMKFPDVLDEETGVVLEEGQLVPFENNPKLDSLMEVLKDKKPHQKTIVWCHYKQDIVSIADRCKKEGIDCVSYYSKTSDKERINAVYRFNCDPSCTVFIGNAGSGGTGLNLLGYDHGNEAPKEKTVSVNSEFLDYYCNKEEFSEVCRTKQITNQDTVCDHAIYYSQDWSQPKRSQSEKRCHRKGTKSVVRISDLVVPGTIDSEIRHRVQLKIETANEIGDVRDVLKRLIAATPSTNGD